jgi:hypothetical protein
MTPAPIPSTGTVWTEQACAITGLDGEALRKLGRDDVFTVRWPSGRSGLRQRWRWFCDEMLIWRAASEGQREAAVRAYREKIGRPQDRRILASLASLRRRRRRT